MSPEDVKKIEDRIDNGEYSLIDKILYGGLFNGFMILPTNIIKIIYTMVFPPLGIIIDSLIDEFPFIDLNRMIFDMDKIVYSIILTCFFYFPGLIFSLSHINNDEESQEYDNYKKAEKNLANSVKIK